MPLASKAQERALPAPSATDVASSQRGRVSSRTLHCSWARFKFTHSLGATGGKWRAAAGARLSGGKQRAIHDHFYSRAHAFMNVTALSQGHWSFMFSTDSCSAMNINALLTCWVFLNGKWVDQAGCVPHLRFSVEHCINNNNHHHHLDYLRVLLHLLQIIWSIKNNLQMQYYKTQT